MNGVAALRTARTLGCLASMCLGVWVLALPALPQTAIFQQEIAPSIFGLAYDAGRNKLYVAEAGPQARTEPSRVLQVNPDTLTVEKSIELTDSVFDVVLSGDGAQLYAVHTTDQAFSVIDLARGAVQAKVRLDRARTAQDKDSIIVIRKIVADEGRDRLFLAETTWPHGALFVVNAKTLTVEKILPDVGLFAMGMALDADGGRLFIGNMDHEILVLDTRSLEMVQRWKVNVDQPIGMVYDSAHNLLYVGDQGRDYWTQFMAVHAPGYRALGKGNKVVVVNAANGQTLREIPTGAGPLDLLLTPDGTRLIVSQREDGSIAIYDTTTGAQTQRHALPPHPNSLALDAQGKRVFVTVKEPITRETLPESVARIPLSE